MEKIKGNLKHASFMLLYVVVGLLYSIFDSPNGKIHHLSTIYDNEIPFIKAFIIPYNIWYVFIVFGLVFLLFKNKRMYYKTVIALSIGVSVCYLIYSFYQSTVPRPELVGNDFLTRLVRATYSNDAPYNCFPSIHVYTTSIIMININLSSDLGKISKILMSILGVTIILSTLFVKQHVILDGAAGVFLAIFAFNFVNIVEEVVIRVWKRKLSL